LTTFLACAGLAAAGSALVLLEFSLTRLYGFVNPSGSVFMAIGLPAIGLASGAFLVHRLGWRPRRRPPLGAFGAALAGSMVALLTSAFAAGTIAGVAFLEGLLAYLAFAAAGMAIAAGYALVPRHAAFASAAQFAAIGTTAAAVPALIDARGPLTTALSASAAFGIAAAILAAAWLRVTIAQKANEEWEEAESDGVRQGLRWLSMAATGVFAVLALAALPANLIGDWPALEPARMSSSKSLFAGIRHPNQPERIVSSYWSYQGRSDVTESAQATGARWLYHDGAFAGWIHQAREGSVLPEAARLDIGNLPFLLPGSREKVLVIGAGGGQEVLMALSAGAREVVIAEPSAAVLAALRDLGDYNGRLLERTGVRVVNRDGRDFLRSTSEQFDIIYLAVGHAGTAQPGGVTTGSLQHTIQAYGDYMDRLRQDGRLVVRLRNEQEFMRAFNSAFQLWTGRGASPIEALRRLVAINNLPMAEQTGDGIVLPLLTVRKTPYVEDEVRRVVDVLSQTPYLPLYLPGLEQMSPLTAFAVEEVGPVVLEAQAPYDIRPVTDTNPFFFEAGKGIPWSLTFAPLGMLLLTAGIAWLSRRPSWENDEVDAIESGFLEDDVPRRYLLFAAIVGVGWGFVQLPLLHQFPLLLGDASLSAPIALGTIYLAAGVGSLLSSRFGLTSLRPVIGWAAFVGGLLAVALLELLPMMATALSGQSMLMRTAAVAAVLAPLGLCLGIPFPSVVRLLASSGRGGWTALMWGVAVLGFSTAQVYALAFGVAWTFTVPTLLGATCLFAAFMMVGLRALPFAAPPAEIAKPVQDLTPYQRPPAEVSPSGPTA
jgi:MFS family permease